MKRPFKPNQDYVSYLGRNIPRKFFRTFVYDQDGEKKLANSWEECSKLIATGKWFLEPQEKQLRRTTRRDKACS